MPGGAGNFCLCPGGQGIFVCAQGGREFEPCPGGDISTKSVKTFQCSAHLLMEELKDQESCLVIKWLRKKISTSEYNAYQEKNPTAAPKTNM